MDISVRVIVAAVIIAAVGVISSKSAKARCLANCAHDGETYIGYDGYVRAYYGGYYGRYPRAYYGPYACPIYVTQRYVRGCYRY